jgi:hypothetical protein
MIPIEAAHPFFSSIRPCFPPVHAFINIHCQRCFGASSAASLNHTYFFSHFDIAMIEEHLHTYPSLFFP